MPGRRRNHKDQDRGRSASASASASAAAVAPTPAPALETNPASVDDAEPHLMHRLLSLISYFYTLVFILRNMSDPQRLKEEIEAPSMFTIMRLFVGVLSTALAIYKTMDRLYLLYIQTRPDVLFLRDIHTGLLKYQIRSNVSHRELWLRKESCQHEKVDIPIDILIEQLLAQLVEKGCVLPGAPASMGSEVMFKFTTIPDFTSPVERLSAATKICRAAVDNARVIAVANIHEHKLDSLTDKLGDEKWRRQGMEYRFTLPDSVEIERPDLPRDLQDGYAKLAQLLGIEIEKIGAAKAELIAAFPVRIREPLIQLVTSHASQLVCAAEILPQKSLVRILTQIRERWLKNIVESHYVLASVDDLERCLSGWERLKASAPAQYEKNVAIVDSNRGMLQQKLDELTRAQRQIEGRQDKSALLLAGKLRQGIAVVRCQIAALPTLVSPAIILREAQATVGGLKRELREAYRLNAPTQYRQNIEAASAKFQQLLRRDVSVIPLEAGKVLLPDLAAGIEAAQRHLKPVREVTVVEDEVQDQGALEQAASTASVVARLGGAGAGSPEASGSAASAASASAAASAVTDADLQLLSADGAAPDSPLRAGASIDVVGCDRLVRNMNYHAMRLLEFAELDYYDKIETSTAITFVSLFHLFGFSRYGGDLLMKIDKQRFPDRVLRLSKLSEFANQIIHAAMFANFDEIGVLVKAVNNVVVDGFIGELMAQDRCNELHPEDDIGLVSKEYVTNYNVQARRLRVQDTGLYQHLLPCYHGIQEKTETDYFEKMVELFGIVQQLREQMTVESTYVPLSMIVMFIGECWSRLLDMRLSDGEERTPDSLGRAQHELQEQFSLSDALVNFCRRAVGVRNRLAHNITLNHYEVDALTENTARDFAGGLLSSDFKAELEQASQARLGSAALVRA